MWADLVQLTNRYSCSGFSVARQLWHIFKLKLYLYFLGLTSQVHCVRFTFRIIKKKKKRSFYTLHFFFRSTSAIRRQKGDGEEGEIRRKTSAPLYRNVSYISTGIFDQIWNAAFWFSRKSCYLTGRQLTAQSPEYFFLELLLQKRLALAVTDILLSAEKWD